MRAFRFFLALAAAAGTFYSLNVLAVQRGYRDRLDFSNHHYQHEHCQEHWKNKGFNHHFNKALDTAPTQVDTAKRSTIYTH
ncbi:hypothetical protein [Pedobacter rhizosphaerae]|uniref:Uncharacterized protein n=1 Tax=Pedobacter rhizosphaerae TaxID=390241 RepID=A0A1H9J5R2_9SPHI|nr:hypothetical protein [Pedobacter rhizosphaerae]SEQ82069.1 hypothetical protein SAMN04488023_101227 [Pedobacter rhizosphaerae]